MSSSCSRALDTVLARRGTGVSGGTAVETNTGDPVPQLLLQISTPGVYKGDYNDYQCMLG